MEALSSKKTFATELHKGALQDMEEYFGLKGLLNNSAAVSYKRHNTRVHEALQAAAAAQSAGSRALLYLSLAVIGTAKATEYTRSHG